MREERGLAGAGTALGHFRGCINLILAAAAPALIIPGFAVSGTM